MGEPGAVDVRLDIGGNLAVDLRSAWAPRVPAGMPHFPGYCANNERSMALAVAWRPATLRWRWSPLSYAGSRVSVWAGSRTAASRSTTASKLPLVRIQLFTVCL